MWCTSGWPFAWMSGMRSAFVMMSKRFCSVSCSSAVILVCTATTCAACAAAGSGAQADSTRSCSWLRMSNTPSMPRRRVGAPLPAIWIQELIKLHLGFLIVAGSYTVVK